MTDDRLISADSRVSEPPPCGRSASRNTTATGNDWLAEYCSYAPTRMAGLAMISLYDPKAGTPHQASSWPHSQEVVARDFKDASAEDRGSGR